MNILVVAEEADSRHEIESILADMGQNVIQARTGREALRWLLRNDFAAILFEANMPESTGIDFATIIRKRKRTEHTPIIFVTNSENGNAAGKDSSLGTVDYVSKPLDPQVLRSKVGVFVDLYEKTETIRQQADHRVQLVREQTARQAAEKAMRRSALLAEASRVLSRSLDFDATLINLHRVIVPALADACQVLLYDSNGDLWFAPVESQDLKGRKSSSGSHSRIQMVSPALAEAVKTAIETLHAQSIPQSAANNAPDLCRDKIWSSLVVVPLVARDIPLGAIVACRENVRRRFATAEVALVEDLAGRAATALDNAQLYQTIREGERRKDEFLAMLGHELRNPLAAITNAGELTQLLNTTDPSFRDTLDIIRQQAALMRRLVDDLLDVSRITSGRIQLQKAVVSAGEVMAHVVEAVGPLITSRGHALHLSAPSQAIYLEADPCRLEQVLSNLMVNAAKYTDSGGDIWFTAERKEQEVIFRIRDSGIGMGPDLLPNVFDLFLQANRSLHRAEGGLGIGLTIVRGLTELHGGRVWVTSEGIGRGSEFFVALPVLSETPAKLPSKTPQRPKFDDQPRHILVVEDQPALSHVTVALLRKLGHQVRSAVDGPDAILAVKEHRPDVVFLDIGLPGMDGYEVAQSLRAELGDAAPLLIAMTGYGQHEVNRHAKKVQFDHHLVKPADIGALRDILASVRV